jgi:hypothetical protein
MKLEVHRVPYAWKERDTTFMYTPQQAGHLYSVKLIL